jgi:hypothetical protein
MNNPSLAGTQFGDGDYAATFGGKHLAGEIFKFLRILVILVILVGNLKNLDKQSTSGILDSSEIAGIERVEGRDAQTLAWWAPITINVM